MLLALALSVLAGTGDPPIRIKLSADVFFRGEQVRVKVKTAETGYLVVLRADAQGRIRILFPLDPTDSGAIRGGKEMEIRGRGDRAAFTVDDGEGSGKIVAASSAQPFRFDAFARAGHWDYGALAGDDSLKDPEAALLALVERMAAGPYQYDLITYTVSAHPPLRRNAGWRWAGGWGWGWGGRGWGRGWYDPWYFGCVSCRPWFYGPVFRW